MITNQFNDFKTVKDKVRFLLETNSALRDNDIQRRNTIANLMAEWGLVKLVDADKTKDNVAPLSQIKILPFKDKNDWQLVSKYTIGKKKKDPV